MRRLEQRVLYIFRFAASDDHEMPYKVHGLLKLDGILSLWSKDV